MIFQSTYLNPRAAAWPKQLGRPLEIFEPAGIRDLGLSVTQFLGR